MKRFGIIGVGAYVAPRHVRAIAETGNELVCAFDPYDNVGHLDRYFRGCAFFKEFARFDRFVYKLKRDGKPIDYMVITTPNYLHDSYICYSLRMGIDAVCEKPLVISPWNIDGIKALERETERRCFSILQMRLHAETKRLEEMIIGSDHIHHEVKISYVTPRGPWYDVSWKNDIAKSGGLPHNIGIHFFDLLTHIFGHHSQTYDLEADKHTVQGKSVLARADASWLLSVDTTLSETPSRIFEVDGDRFDFSTGFEDLHTVSYREILDGNGFGTDEARAGIAWAHKIKLATQSITSTKGVQQ
jgi:UDP-N-acetyl-2-amino-2-deoxyglucuronate dehydrogenase